MYMQVEKPKGSKGRAVANSVIQKKSNTKQGFGFVDNRTLPIAQRKLQEEVNNSPQSKQAAQLYAHANLQGTINLANVHIWGGMPVQRVIIPAAEVDGMGADLDSTNYDAAKQLIDELFDRGKRDGLFYLKHEIGNDTNSKNNRKLVSYIDSFLKKQASSDPDAKTSGYWDTRSMNRKYEKPEVVDPDVQAGLKMWIAGDPDNTIGWKTIGLYLQGRLPINEIRSIGDISFWKTLKNDEYLKKVDHDKEEKGKELIVEAIRKLRGALDALPKHDGLTYRQAGIANGSVYGGAVNVGDLIKDTAFWSTSALKLDGSAGKWGSDGTQDDPMVYFIINGKTGKYINKYAELEEGQHEVLYKDGTVFRVTKIANYKKETFFVHVTEVDPTTITGIDIIKNPFTGDEY